MNTALLDPSPSSTGAALSAPEIGAGRQPLRIEWELCTPTVRGEFPLHLDGLLSSVAFRRAQAGGLDPWPARLDLPLARGTAHHQAGGSEEWVFAASQILFVQPVGPPTSVTMTRRANITHMAKLIDRGVLVTGRSFLEVGTGPDKSVLLHVPTQFFARAVAYCIGDGEAIRAMLARVSQLGSERRLGYGQVRSFSVMPDDRAVERWRWRSLPFSMKAWTGDDHFVGQGTVRPDYFARDQRVNCLEWHGPIPTDLTPSS